MRYKHKIHCSMSAGSGVGSIRAWYLVTVLQVRRVHTAISRAVYIAEGGTK